MPKFDHIALKHWFHQQKRDFPWRKSLTPYAIWVSEVMLQQTQAAVVVPYFEKWMQLFPTVRDLAQAELEKVIKTWEGLGYYSRARSLHAGAKYLLEHFNGEIPDSKEELKKIKGLGDYTIGAIRSFAFHCRTAAVDGNVVRVLTRYFNIHDDISKQKTLKNLREIAESILPQDESWIVNEALIELGATVCNRKPKCNECPLRSSCAAYREGIPDQLPVKTAKITIQNLFRAVAIIHCEDHLLVSKGAKGKIMSDLYEFPYFEITQQGLLDNKFEEMIFQNFGLKVYMKEDCLNEVKHSFTRYRVTLKPKIFSTLDRIPIEGYEWLTIRELEKLPFSSGHRKIFIELSTPLSNSLCNINITIE